MEILNFYVSLHPVQADLFIVQPASAGAGASKAVKTELINVRNNLSFYFLVISLVINSSENFSCLNAFLVPDLEIKQEGG
jgi:hypothetical protein